MDSLKDTILAAEDLLFKDVPVPEWGEDTVVRVRGLTDEQVGAWQAKSTSLRLKARRGEDPDVEVKIAQRRAELLVQCLFNPETDKLIFTNADARKLAKKNAGVIQGLHELATDLSGLDRKFDEQVKDAEADFSDGQS
jgi:hypothetical protein